MEVRAKIGPLTSSLLTTAPCPLMQIPYHIRSSPIAGSGIFATVPIKRGERVWRYEIGVSVTEHGDEASLRARLKSLSAAEAQELLEHVYTWKGCVIEILDDAKIWNHSADHNTGNHPDEASGQGDGLSSYARRDIKAGEELTDDYATFEDIPWYEALCVEYGASSCVVVGRANRGPVKTRVKKEPLALVVVAGIFVLLSIIGFVWANATMATRSAQFLAELDYRSATGATTAGGCAVLAAITLYYINYPEGQLASDAVAMRGATPSLEKKVS